MRAVDLKTLALMQTDIEGFMLDSCSIGTRTTTTIAGVSKVSYTYVASLCQWLSDEKGSSEFIDGAWKPVTELRASVLFPMGSVITAESVIAFQGRKWGVISVSPAETLAPCISVRVKETK